MSENRLHPSPFAENNGRAESYPTLLPKPHRSVTGLPRFLTTFIGRDEAIGNITALLSRDDVRMLTLIGPGGSGKTRLAVEVVERLPPGAWDDIWFISLAAVRDPGFVVPDIAQAVGVGQVSDRPVAETLIGFLRERHALLVIDNFEPVVAAGPDLADFLRACPGITMLVTSRIALQVSGEHLVVVPPLELPGTTHLPIERLRSLESVRLFVERAQASSSTFALTEENASVVVDICRRLDGLPLALELAAARCGMLSPAALLQVLAHQRGILSGGPRDAPERHQSMRSAIAWSYDLLPEHEQMVFRRLSTFAGGFTLEAAETVVDLPGNLLETLTSLTAKSLIVPVTSDDVEPRFTMLETLREYGLERLDEAGEEAATRDRHAAFFLEEAIQGEFAWCMFLSDGLFWLRRLVTDHGNMREALQWLQRQGDILRCLRMAAALAALWVVWGSLPEGYQWLDRLLRDPRATPGPERTNALATFSWVSRLLGKSAQSLEMAEECIAMGRDVDDPLAVTRCHVLAGAAAANIDQHDLAIQRHQGAIDYVSGLDNPPWRHNFIVIASAQLGLVNLLRGRITQAERHLKTACDHDLRRGFEPGTSFIYGNQVLNGLAHVARARTRPAEALRLYQRNLRLAVRNSNNNFCVHALCDIAGALAAISQHLVAARLFGASEALHETYGYEFTRSLNIQRALGLPEPWARESEPCGTAEALRDALRPRTVPVIPASITADALERAWAEGRTLSLDAAVAEALAAAPVKDITPEPGHNLTPRQMEILRLLVDGLSNRAIAERLSLSERTVEHHIMHILDRLGVESRTAAAIHAVREKLV